MATHTNHPHVSQAMQDRIALAEMAKFLMSGGLVSVTKSNGKPDFDLFFAYEGEGLPVGFDKEEFAALQTGLFVRNAVNKPMRWLAAGPLDELHYALEDLGVGHSFPLRLLRDPSGPNQVATKFMLAFQQSPKISLPSRVDDEAPFSTATYLSNFRRQEAEPAANRPGP